MARAAARRLAILVCVDGLASYVTAFARFFRDPDCDRPSGPARLVPTAGHLLGQVIMHRAGRVLTGVTRRVASRDGTAIAAVLMATATGTGITRAYIEQGSTRRSAGPATRGPVPRPGDRSGAAPTAGLYLVGYTCNFCWLHYSLRLPPAPVDGGDGRADPGDCGRPDGPSLDDAGVAQLSDPAAALGAAEATGATSQTIPGGHGMTTVPCGATISPKLRQKIDSLGGWYVTAR